MKRTNGQKAKMQKNKNKEFKKWAKNFGNKLKIKKLKLSIFHLLKSSAFGPVSAFAPLNGPFPLLLRLEHFQASVELIFQLDGMRKLS